MTTNSKYAPDDLVLFVWPRQSEPDVSAGRISWEDAAREAWAMDADKADRVKLLVAVFEDEVMGSWRVEGAHHKSSVPQGKSRHVSRSNFDTVEDKRLHYLLGSKSQLPPRRNPQATFELRDLRGSEVLLDSSPAPSEGLTQLGAFTFSVESDGSAELRMPVGSVLTVRTY